MTRHLHEDIGKLPVSLDEADPNIKLLEAAKTLGICSSHLSAVSSLPEITPEPLTVKPKKRTISLRTRLGKILHKLYDMENDHAPEKPLNVDLAVDLYQMEKY